jgi:hypothetical protein
VWVAVPTEPVATKVVTDGRHCGTLAASRPATATGVYKQQRSPSTTRPTAVDVKREVDEIRLPPRNRDSRHRPRRERFLSHACLPRLG